MELPEVTTATPMDARREAQQAGIGRPGADKEAAAHRLRARGFSYRRIAETLRIRYDTVSRWLCGEPPSDPIVVARPFVPAAPVAHTPPRAPALEARLAALEAALARYQQDAVLREERLLAALAEVRDALQASAAAGRARRMPWEAERERA